MSAATVNGDKSSSQFLSHLTSYPVVSDSISTFKSNPYGAKSLDLADSGYKSFVAPVLPYAQGPYGYVKPYVAKADEIADTGLSKVDNTFPIVKQDTQKIQSTVMGLVHLPFVMAFQGKDYVFKTYGNEYKKCGGKTYIDGVKALITTSLVITSDSLSSLSGYLSQKKEQSKEVVKDKTGN